MAWVRGKGVEMEEVRARRARLVAIVVRCTARRHGFWCEGIWCGSMGLCYLMVALRSWGHSHMLGQRR
jgi:hypothetical protein